MTHSLPSTLDDPARLLALDAAAILDTPPEEAFDRLTRMAQRLLQTPVALISLVDARRQFFKSHQGLPGPVADARETPLSHSMCQHVVIDGAPLAVGDALAHPVMRTNRAVIDLGAKAYLGVPLRAPTGEVLGSFCVIDNKPREWTDEDVAVLNDLAAIATDELVLRQEVARRRASERSMSVLVRELHHRVKNSLATVQAIVQLSLRSADSLETFAKSISARINSLANAHTLVATRDWTVAALRDLLNSELDAYQKDGRITLTGPDLDIDADAAVNVGMIIHELATNACKYGALSVETGALHVSWEVDTQSGGRRLRIDWRERNGPPVKEPSRRGFGTTLMHRLAASALHGKITFAYQREGLHVHLDALIAAAPHKPVSSPAKADALTALPARD